MTTRKKITTRRVIQYFWQITKKQKLLFFLTNIGGISAMIISLVLPIFFAKIIDIVSIDAAREALVGPLLGVLSVIIGLEILSIGSWRLFGFTMVPFETRSMKRIFLDCFAYINRHSYRFFTNNFSGMLVKRMNKLAYSFESIIDTFSFNIIRMLIGLPFIIVTIRIQNTTLGIIFLCFILLFIAIQFLFFKMQIPYETRSNIQDSKASGELSDAITNHFNILTFASLKRELKRFGGVIGERQYLTNKKRLRSEWMFFISSMLLVIFEILVIYYVIIFWGAGLISTGVIVLAQTYIFKVFEQLFNVRNVLKNLNRAFGEATEMLEILDEPHEIMDRSNKKIEVKSGKIEFQNVKFDYIDGNSIFNGLNLRIKSGEKIAVVGQSGGGKTTLVKLLLRFFDIQGGEILIDGQNIAEVAQDSLRDSISMVPQDPMLFHRSIKENIAYGKPNASDEEIIAAAKMARCHDFIANLSDGYDTFVGERGIKLSGGERQRVAIARAILANKRILVLDEATSSLDSESEQLIQEAMDEVMKNKTVIIIAHRLSTIMKMDKIIVMEQGGVVESGSHKELLAQGDGVYKNLRDIQSGGFENGVVEIEGNLN